MSADAVWVTNTLDDTVSWVGPDTNKVEGTVGVGNVPSEITVVEGTVWVGDEGDGTLSRIEAAGQTPVLTAIGSVPQGLAGWDGALWVSVRGTATLTPRRDAETRFARAPPRPWIRRSPTIPIRFLASSP